MSNMERIPPHSEEAEKSVLGGCLLDKDVLTEVESVLIPDDFYLESHKEIFATCLDLSARNISCDLLTVSEELKKRQTLEKVGGRAYVAELTAGVPTTANVMQYATIVKDNSVLRQVIKASSNVMENAFAGAMEANQVVNEAEQAIFQISQGDGTSSYCSLQDALKGNLVILDELSKNKTGLTGVMTGFRDLDARTAGFQKANLITLAARPGMGKTSFALSLAHQSALRAGSKILMFSLEMSRTELSQKLLSIDSKVEMGKLKIGDLSNDDWGCIYRSVERLSKAQIFIDDTPNPSIMEMRSRARRLKAEKGLDMIIVDYLQLMAGNGRVESRTQEISNFTRQLKMLAREIDVPVLLLSQLSREPEKRPGDHRPMLSDLRDSGSIEQDSDVVIFLYRDEYYTKENSPEPGICEIITAKQRSGQTGTDRVAWIGKQTRFVDVPVDVLKRLAEARSEREGLAPKKPAEEQRGGEVRTPFGQEKPAEQTASIPPEPEREEFPEPEDFGGMEEE